MKFFKRFPFIEYDLFSDGSSTILTDLFRYAALREALVIDEDISSYLITRISNGERPDVLSQKLYGTPDYYWTFFILNPKLLATEGLNWPKNLLEFENFIKEKYGPFSVLNFRPTYSQYQFPRERGSALPSRTVTISQNNLSGFPLSEIESVLDGNENIVAGTPYSFDSARGSLWIDRLKPNANGDRVIFNLKESADVRAVVAYMKETNEYSYWENLFKGMEKENLFTDILNDDIDTFVLNSSETINFINEKHLLEFYPSAVYRFSQDAPYSYGVNRTLSWQNVGATDLIFTTYLEREEAINEDLSTIRTVRPDRIRTFSEDYFSKLEI